MSPIIKIGIILKNQPLIEATAVEDILRHPLKALWISLQGPRTSREMVPDPVGHYPVERPRPQGERELGGPADSKPVA